MAWHVLRKGGEGGEGGDGCWRVGGGGNWRWLGEGVLMLLGRSFERGPLGEPMSVRSGRKEENRLERRLMEELE